MTLSTTALPGTIGVEREGKLRAVPLGRGYVQAQPTVRRRGSLEQGLALEMLGHAVEYLADERMFRQDADGARTDTEAIQILMQLSRAVFAECPEVVPMRQRLRRWLNARHLL